MIENSQCINNRLANTYIRRPERPAVLYLIDACKVVMFRKIYPLFIALTALVFTMPVWSYDVDSANAYAELFADAKGATTGKNLHLFPAEKFVDDIKTQKPMVVLDVRTPKETSIVSITLPGTLN